MSQQNSAKALRSLDKDQLQKELEIAKKELARFRVSKVAGTGTLGVHDILTARKNIARINTVITQNIRASTRKAFLGKRMPHDLRAKKTRAIRRALPAHLKEKKTLRAQKKAAHFGQRLYALKA
ncbi:hypothetical protein, variant [Fonticula alba]|uniref:50S ribosomal protein L29 n=1 Tax=Fonticula alba TaxID=691883 RepID=A0A058Z746_FONAL|nr:hypothetical protein, variant [Fonticula alba]KCV70075.1 hypothetical protein, variant [Fonticula alba]|eukprot:XP_009495681.1 hypothetical protein, variant [Fonticula alba]